MSQKNNIALLFDTIWDVLKPEIELRIEIIKKLRDGCEQLNARNYMSAVSLSKIYDKLNIRHDSETDYLKIFLVQIENISVVITFFQKEANKDIISDLYFHVIHKDRKNSETENYLVSMTIHDIMDKDGRLLQKLTDDYCGIAVRHRRYGSWCLYRSLTSKETVHNNTENGFGRNSDTFWKYKTLFLGDFGEIGKQQMHLENRIPVKYLHETKHWMIETKILF